MAHKVNAIQSGDQTIVIVDGDHYRRSGDKADRIYELALRAQTNPSEDNIDDLINALDPQAEAVADGLLHRDDMGNYTLPGFNTPVPKSMSDFMLDLYDRDIPADSLEKFWKQALMNPNAQARDDLFKYCQDYGITITQNGYLLLYKAVNNNPASNFDQDLIDRVGSEYLRIRREGDNPNNYHILRDNSGEYHTIREDVLDDLNIVADVVEADNLEEVDPREGKFGEILDAAIKTGLVENTGADTPMVHIPFQDKEDLIVQEDKLRKGHAANKAFWRVRDLVAEYMDDDIYVDYGSLRSVYRQAQDAHDGQFEPSSIAKRQGGQYGMSINLGEPQPMPREECDPSINQSCSKGLHVGSYDYVSSFGSKRDRILACIVSPRDIVALPKRDNSKLRTCLYVPYAIMERDEDGNWEEIQETEVDFEYMDEESDMDSLLEELEEEDDLTDIQKDRKKVIEDRLQSIK